jgi:hypothetical protein
MHEKQMRSKLRSLVSQMPNQDKSGSKRNLLMDEYEHSWIYEESSSTAKPRYSDFSDAAIFAEFERSLRKGLHDSMASCAFYSSSSIWLDSSDEEDDELVEISESFRTEDEDDDADGFNFHDPKEADPSIVSKFRNDSNHTAETLDMNSSMRLSDVFECEASSLDSHGTFHRERSNTGKRSRNRQRQNSSLQELFA